MTKRDSSIYVAKTKALISCEADLHLLFLMARLICYIDYVSEYSMSLNAVVIKP